MNVLKNEDSMNSKNDFFNESGHLREISNVLVKNIDEYVDDRGKKEKILLELDKVITVIVNELSKSEKKNSDSSIIERNILLFNDKIKKEYGINLFGNNINNFSMDEYDKKKVLDESILEFFDNVDLSNYTRSGTYKVKELGDFILGIKDDAINKYFNNNLVIDYLQSYPNAFSIIKHDDSIPNLEDASFDKKAYYYINNLLLNSLIEEGLKKHGTKIMRWIDSYVNHGFENTRNKDVKDMEEICEFFSPEDIKNLLVIYDCKDIEEYYRTMYMNDAKKGRLM